MRGRATASVGGGSGTGFGTGLPRYTDGRLCNQVNTVEGFQGRPPTDRTFLSSVEGSIRQLT